MILLCCSFNKRVLDKCIINIYETFFCGFYIKRMTNVKKEKKLQNKKNNNVFCFFKKIFLYMNIAMLFFFDSIAKYLIMSHFLFLILYVQKTMKKIILFVFLKFFDFGFKKKKNILCFI